jgi:hypothetical protein
MMSASPSKSYAPTLTSIGIAAAESSAGFLA